MGLNMNCNKPSSPVVNILFIALLALGSEALDAREAGGASKSFAVAETVKQQCKNVCRARYRACFSLKQIPSFVVEAFTRTASATLAIVPGDD